MGDVIEDTKPTLDDLWAEDENQKPETPPTPLSRSPSSKHEHKSPFPGSTSPPSASPIGEEDLKPRTARASSSTSKTKSRKASPEVFKPVLIDDLPTAWDEAHETFEALEKCVYERKDIGLSKENDEMMVCECVYNRHDPDTDPCGPDSDCINRALYIECIAGECRAGKHCHNQQFSKKQYANVDVVLTEKKGYGLRASSIIPANTLIYEYIGEVVAEKTFRKRMQQYADEGIRHFYFMMLQKEEYIDATKKGGIGRFANHSCNPNCEVQKWVVGRRLRMGIFTKRDVVKGEEITFNYNVDRYGHDAQTCYCGEPNCVGTIGGKTQTDISTMNDLFLDALGITDEVEAMGMKGSKKKKSRQLDEDFVPILRPIGAHEVQKVAAAIRQSMENKNMMSRLLQRIQMTDDGAMHRQLMRMHGFSLMYMVLTELADDKEIVLLALESMNKWKLQIRNKIEDSNIEEPVKVLGRSEDETICGLAKQLIEYWSTLELSYKIPRVSKIASLDADDEAGTQTIAEANVVSAARRPDAWENTQEIQIDIAPVRPRTLPVSRPRPPLPPPPPVKKPALNSVASTDRLKLDAIIAMAEQTVQAQAAAAAVEATASPQAGSSRSGSRPAEDEERRKRQKRTHMTEEELAEQKERRLRKLIGAVVVKSMNKYKDMIEHDTFKKYARECTDTLVKKEKKSPSYQGAKYPSLSDDKKAKIKSFTKDYTHKILKHLKEKGKLLNPKSSSTLKTSGNDPNHAASSSTNGDTPGISTPSQGGVSLEAAQSLRDGELMDDIFGADEDMAMDLDEDASQMQEDHPVSPSIPPATPPLPPVRIEVVDSSSTPASQ
ncbi:histone-lysine N-methyltransferase, H3 lysine-36 specific [Cryptococcus gattii E566]|uniref:Histone-lysine N-methyltransferase, H3 lysine-36 specific n=1 Tax=Cryptococcus gattii EJB2 TaxID=1296103 RepID=A0ABR5BQG1_9TREE|nr:histone-lysine N-methyltransferase, H3 lysine-36 specific [Cryptococcus gattii EJB2]KIY31976.1 histone-lysine N-methyltransferase, H3 lysine-36 specific [Cryptococcus gattii E566]